MTTAETIRKFAALPKQIRAVRLWAIHASFTLEYLEPVSGKWKEGKTWDISCETGSVCGTVI